MRIAFDARSLNRPHLRGMGKYLHNVVRRIAERTDDRSECVLLCDRPDLPVHRPSDKVRAEAFDLHLATPLDQLYLGLARWRTKHAS